MKQKLYLSLLTASLLSLPLVSYAELGNIESGFFVGLGATVAAMNYGYKDISFVSIKKSTNPILLRPDLYGGYGELASSNNLYFGFDVGAQLGHTSAKEVAYYNEGPVVNTAQQGTVYYADIMPGLVLGNQSSILYAIAGATHGNFTLKQNANNYSMTEGHFGYRIGAGYTLALTNNFSVNAKYLFSNFGGIKYAFGLDKFELNPKDNQLSLGVNYTFGGDEAANSTTFLED